MNVVFLVVAAVGLIAAAAFLWFCLVKAVRLPRGWGIAVTILLGLLIVASVAATLLSRSLGTTPYRLALIAATCGVPVLAYLALGLVIVCLVNLIWWWATRQRTAAVAGRNRRLTTVRVLTVVALVASLVTTGYGFVEAQRPAVTPVTLSFPNLPANFDGLTIALVADLHIGATTRGSFLPMLVDQVNAAHPDLIVIAGDIADGSVDSLADAVRPLEDLAAPYGVVVTTGNHDIYSGAAPWMAYLRTLGLTVLDNDAIALQRGDQSIQILGINDRQGQGAEAPDLQLAYNRAEALTGDAADQFRILVAHEPVQALADNGLAGRLGIDLQLSGHTHGGQLWPLGYLAYLQQPVISGVHDVGGVTVVTSRGVGTWGPPVRVGADPEVPLITLRTG